MSNYLDYLYAFVLVAVASFMLGFTKENTYFFLNAPGQPKATPRTQVVWTLLVVLPWLNLLSLLLFQPTGVTFHGVFLTAGTASLFFTAIYWLLLLGLVVHKIRAHDHLTYGWETFYHTSQVFLWSSGIYSVFWLAFHITPD